MQRKSTPCGPVMQYGDISIRQHWPRQRLVAWRYQATTWTSVDFWGILWHSPEVSVRPSARATFRCSEFENHTEEITATPSGDNELTTFRLADSIFSRCYDKLVCLLPEIHSIAIGIWRSCSLAVPNCAFMREANQTLRLAPLTFWDSDRHCRI